MGGKNKPILGAVAGGFGGECGGSVAALFPVGGGERWLGGGGREERADLAVGDAGVVGDGGREGGGGGGGEGQSLVFVAGF